jgi:hypothetical protein
MVELVDEALVSVRHDGIQFATAQLIDKTGTHCHLRFVNPAGIANDYKLPIDWITRDQAKLVYEAFGPVWGDIRAFLGNITTARTLTGLDEKIKLAGRMTTIRDQWQAGKVQAFRLNDGPKLGQHPLWRWVRVDIEKDPSSTEEFYVSEADFKSLRGEAA